MAITIDSVVNVFTPAEMNHCQTGFDDAFMAQVRMPESCRSWRIVPPAARR